MRETGGLCMNNTAHAHCTLDTLGYKHTLRTCNTHRFSTTKMVTRTRPNVMLYVHCMFCLYWPRNMFTESAEVVESGWYMMTHGEAREGKWRGNWRMQCVASTLHTTSEHGVSSITTADANTSAASSRLNWRPPADLNGLANGVCSQYPSHYLGTWCIQHYYRWCAHLGCQ